MEKGLPSELIADVIPIRGWRNIEEINGRRIDLSKLSRDELNLLKGQCHQRLCDAQLDHAIVQEAITRREVADAGADQ